MPSGSTHFIKDGHSSCRAQWAILSMSAEILTFPGSRNLLHEIYCLAQFILHLSGKCWACLPRICHTGCMNRQSYELFFFFFFSRNKAQSKLSQVKQSAQPGSVGCPPRAISSSFPITRGVQITDLKKELTVVTSGNTVLGKGSCHQPNN